jgi:transcriptional regulator with XRE-family HTH domain
METEFNRVLVMVLRNDAGLSQGQLAKMCGVTTGYICNIERGQREPSIRVIQKLAKAFRIPMYRFFIESDSPERQGSHGMPTPGGVGE